MFSRKLSQRTVFAVFIYSNAKCLKVDVVSDYTGHPSLMTKSIMRFLMSKPEVNGLVSDPAIRDVIFWSDNGSHFHSNYFLYYPLCEMINDPSLDLDRVECNFFIPMHGKTFIDQHFSHISYWLSAYSLEWEWGIRSTYDVCRAIEEGTALAAKHYRNRRSDGLDLVNKTVALRS